MTDKICSVRETDKKTEQEIVPKPSKVADDDDNEDDDGGGDYDDSFNIHLSLLHLYILRRGATKRVQQRKTIIRRNNV